MGGNRGKMAAQAGHAYLHTYLAALKHPKTVAAELAHHYTYDGPAYKIALIVDTVKELEDLYETYAGQIGASLVKDAGLTVFTEPTVTCLGLGPVSDRFIGDDIKSLATFK